MLSCIDCKRQFETIRGLKSHWNQTHDPNRKIVDHSGTNNPHYGHKGKNQHSYTDWSTVPWEKLGHGKRRERLLQEANYACTHCGYNKCRDDGCTILEIDHIDGNHKNNERSNLRVLCPNCHGLTPNYRNFGNKGNVKTSTRFRKGNKGFVSQYQLSHPLTVDPHST